MRHHRRLFFRALVVALLVSCALPLAAQPESAPLLLLVNGDYWAWNLGDPAPRPLTQWGYNFRPALSPDGARLAYMGYAPVTVEALARSGGIGGGELPGDIKVLDIAAGTETLIAAQPPDAALMTSDRPEKAVIRGAPVWSPDGARLAWAEFDYPISTANRVVVYDFTTAAASVLVDSLPEQGGVPSPMRVSWGRAGIVLLSLTPQPGVPTYTEKPEFLVYNETGVRLATLPLPEGEFVLDYVLADFGGQEMIAALLTGGRWLLLDPLTGESAPLADDQTPELFAAAAPGTSLAAQFFASDDPSLSRWDVVDPAGAPAGLTLQAFNAPGLSNLALALSPDGQVIASIAVTGGAVEVQPGGEPAQVIVLGEGQTAAALVWSPVAWRVRPPPVG